MYLLKEGRVRLYHLTRDGHEVTTAVLVPGQLFGLGSLFGRGEGPALAECLDNCYVCEAGAQDFLGILARHPLLMARVMMAMARQILRLQESIEHLALEPVHSPLAHHLLTLAEAGTPVPDSCLLPPQTQEEMAKVVASTRETVARMLGAWHRQGLVAMDGRRIVVRDLDASGSRWCPEAEAPPPGGRTGRRSSPRRSLRRWWCSAAASDWRVGPASPASGHG